MRGALVRITLVAALCFTAAGCGDDSPTPKPYSDPSKSASATGAPTMPAAAKGTTDTAKIAFVNHYLDVLSYASKTGETSDLADLTEVGCTSCKGVLNKIKDIYIAGGQIQGRGFSLADAKVLRGVEGKPVVRGRLVAYPQVTRFSKTGPPSSAKQTEGFAQFLLSPSNGQTWLIDQWTRE